MFSGEVLMTTGMAKLINVSRELGIIVGLNNWVKLNMKCFVRQTKDVSKRSPKGATRERKHKSGEVK